MYLMLQGIEASETSPFERKTFGCHQDRHKEPKEVEPCVGWLLNQRERGTPSIALRLLLLREPEATAQFDESESGGELYDTVDELVRVNLLQDQVLHPERYEDDDDDL